MRVLDASAIIYAWDNYPPALFPGLWQWMAGEVQKHELAIPVVALEEVGHKAPECTQWLKSAGVLKLSIGAAELAVALDIKQAIGVVNDQYHPKGVGENDIFIIAVAKVLGVELITNEGRQFDIPLIPSKRRIPAVCDMPGVDVINMNFLEYIQKAQQVF